MLSSARARALPLLAVSASSAFALTTAQAAEAKAPLHRPSLVQTARSGAGVPRFLVSVSPTGTRTAQIAQATVGCSIFSTSGTCAQEHAIALILYGATTASLEQAATDAYNIMVQVVAGTIRTTQDLFNYVIEGTTIVFNVAQDVEDAALNKIAAILGLASASSAAPQPSTPTSPSTPTAPVTPVVTPLPIATGTGTVSIVPLGSGAQSAATRPLTTVRIRLGAVGDSALVPVSARANRQLAALRRRHARVRLVQRMTYRVHQPGDPAPDYTRAETTSRTIRLGR